MIVAVFCLTQCNMLIAAVYGVLTQCNMLIVIVKCNMPTHGPRDYLVLHAGRNAPFVISRKVLVESSGLRAIKGIYGAAGSIRIALGEDPSHAESLVAGPCY